MADSPAKAQFHGTGALAILHLRRLAKSNDVDAGFAIARELHMIDGEQEDFMRGCFDLDTRLEADDQAPDEALRERASRLQRCIFSINSADPA